MSTVGDYRTIPLLSACPERAYVDRRVEGPYGTMRPLASIPCIALLRAVNLAGLNTVAMADLRELMTSLGLEDVTTLLQSGNAVFRSNKPADSLEPMLERAAEKQFGSRIEFFVRTAVEWKAMIAANPFPSEAKADPGHLLAVALKAAPEAGKVNALQEIIKEGERAARDQHARLSRRHRPIEVDERADREDARHARHRSQLEHRAKACRACRA